MLTKRSNCQKTAKTLTENQRNLDVIFTALRHAISETVGVECSKLKESDRVQSDIGADSMAILTIMILLEDELNVTLEISELPTQDLTLKELVELLEKKYAREQ